MLRDTGSVHPVAFFLTEKMSIEESISNIAITLDEGELSRGLNSADIKPSDIIVIVMDMEIGPAQALSVIKGTMDPGAAEVLSAIEATGHRIGVADPAATVTRIMMERLGWNMKDIVAKAIELVIRKTDAIAYVKLDETWVYEAKGKDSAEDFKKFEGSLENHPDAKEALTSFLETEGFVRMVTVGFNRNRPKTGRIIGFEPPKEVIETDSTEPKMKLSGRYAHLFDKARSRPKPPVPASAN